MKLLYAYTQELKDASIRDTRQDVKIFGQLYKFDADAWITDRTRTLNFPFSEHLLDNNVIDDAYRIRSKNIKINFSQAAIEQANDLLDTQLPLYVLWSGGIDSTAILVAFLQTHRCLDKVTVILNYNSIIEYKLFYELYIKTTLKILVTEEAMLLMSLDKLDGIIISGEQADQLVGSTGAVFLEQSSTKSQDDIFNFVNFHTICRKKEIDEPSIRCWYELFSSTFSKSPRPINTMFDFAWWYGFNFKWQKGSVVMYLRAHKNINIQPFYSGLAFQHWSIHYTPELNNIKSEIKDFVFNFTEDTIYYKNKIKHRSSTLYYAVPASAAINQNYNKIQQKDFNLEDFYNPDNSIVRWLTKS
jgi:hypothetical protein